MKALRILAATAGILVALGAFGWVFLSELEHGGGTEEPPGVILAAPPGFAVEERGELPRAAAAEALAALLAERPAASRLGLHFTDGGFELFWLVDRRDAAAPVLTELSGSPRGTRVETTWRGPVGVLDRRLAWAADHGTFAAPELPEGEAKNLYH